MYRVRSLPGFRLLCIFLALIMAFSASAAGLQPLLTGMSKYSQDVLQSLRPAPPAYTDEPTPIFYGDNPLRDEEHRGGLYTDAQLAAIQVQLIENALAHGTINAGTLGMLLVGGGGSGGAPMAWERNLGSVNSQTGNKMTTLPIVSWPIRGGGTLEFQLYHNSKSTRVTPAGYAWTMAYDWSVQQTFDEESGTLTGANIYKQDGTIIPFTYNATTQKYVPPAGIPETLVKNANNTWTYTKKDQTKWNCRDERQLHVLGRQSW
ncbi:MAG: hypothetical protein QOJ64_1238 [Acidobacteriota bacterium]|jgi:hypothetical protein|nr:hypothetical protein [Acidobacteriota bacterium]